MRTKSYLLFLCLSVFILSGCSSDDLKEFAPPGDVSTKANPDPVSCCWWDGSDLTGATLGGAGDSYTATFKVSRYASSITVKVSYDQCPNKATIAYLDSEGSTFPFGVFSYTGDAITINVNSGNGFKWCRLQLVAPAGASVAPGSPAYLKFVKDY